MKIWVAACSTIADAIRLESASCALWVQKPTMPLRLRIFPVLDPLHEHVVVQRLPAFVDDDDGG
jgi:hypothetical protein